MQQFANRGVQSGSRKSGNLARRRHHLLLAAIEPLEGRRLLTAISPSLTAASNSLLVSSTADLGPGSLRQAITTANASASPVIITFDPTVFPAGSNTTITLTSGGLELSNTSEMITIKGPGAGQVTIDGDGNDTVFYVDTDVTAEIDGLTITDGSNPDGGGGISNSGTLTLNNDVITGNTVPEQTNPLIAPADAPVIDTTGDGGGIDDLGTLTTNNCTISNNTAQYGGGVYVESSATDTYTNCTISGNNSDTDGAGGGFFVDGTLYVLGSTISGNTDNGTDGGGGAEIDGNSTFINTTVANNTTSGEGGGLDIYSPAQNVPSPTAKPGVKPAISPEQVAQLTNVTITGNTAAAGGGLEVLDTTATLVNTIVDGNTADSFINNDVTLPDTETILGNNNLFGQIDNPDNVSRTATQFNVSNPQLGTLANNGGPTQTVVPLDGSPAIDAGSTADALDQNGNPLTTDQRGTGFPRVVGNAVDIGAFEVAPSLVVTTTADEDDGTSDPAVGTGTSLREAVNYANSISFSLAINSVDAANGTLAIAAPSGAGLTTGEPIVYNTTGSPIGGLTNGTTYYVINVDSTDVKLATSAANANSGTYITLTSSGSGTQALNNPQIDITFAPAICANGPATIDLSNGSINITGSIAIVGPGANELTIDGNATGDTAFYVGDDNNSTTFADSIAGLTIDNTRTNDGAIYNEKTLTLSGDAFTNNLGSAVDNTDTGTLLSTGNTYTGNGTALLNYNVLDSTNDTIAGASGADQGLQNEAGTATLISDTITGNNGASPSYVGGIIVDGGTVSLGNTIVAGNSSSTAADVSGAFTSLGNNFIGKGDGATGFTNGVSGDQVGSIATPINPQLAPLGYYGGTIETMPPLPGSPVLGKGNTALIPSGVTTDGRGVGFPRTANGMVDIGAIEGTAAPVITTNPKSLFLNAGADAKFTAAATAIPAPTVQWMVEAAGGTTFTPISGQTSTTLDLGAATIGENGNQYEAVFTNAGGSTATTAATLTVTKVTGSLVGQSSVATSLNYNLTQLGTTDWAHWGTFSNPTAFDHKATGGSEISNVTKLGSGSYGAYSDASRTVSWTDGSPLATNAGDQSYIWANNAAGAGYSFTVPANTTTQTVYVDLGGYDSGGTLTAHLSDSSASDYSVSFSGTSHYTDLAAITYKAGSAGQTLTLSYVKTANVGVLGGSVDLVAAWLDGAPVAPQITLNPKNAIVTTGSTVTLTAAATGTPTPAVQWQSNTGAGTPFVNIAGATSTTYSFSATTSQSGDQYRAVFTNPANTVTTSAATLTVSAPAGTLSGTVATAASSYNLTALGTTDWAHWGALGNINGFEHKATGGTKISNVTRLGNGGYGTYTQPTRKVSWTDGTPVAQYGNDQSYLWANDAIGAGYSFTVPASTTTQTLYVYLGGYSSGGTLTAHLSDSSAADYVTTLSGSALYTNVVAITFKAGSAGQTLTLSYAKSQSINGIGGSVDLIAAWLA
jgi:CSLREA domain-containing protein